MLTRCVAQFMRPIDDAARQRARLLLLDWLACLAGARAHEAGALGSIIASSPWERATYSGTALDLGDLHQQSGIEPGAVVWPAAISLPSATMDQRLDAAVRGYEAMIAIGGTLDPHHNAHWDATATTGVFGAAAAFGSLIGFAEVEFVNALGNAGSVASGLRHFAHDDVLTKQWHIHHAVRTGRDAAMHVHYGATGPAGILDGEHGMLSAMMREPGALTECGHWLIEDVVMRPLVALDPATPNAARTRMPDADALIAKLGGLAQWGELSPQAGEEAVAIALQGTDAAALDDLLQRWTG